MADTTSTRSRAPARAQRRPYLTRNPRPFGWIKRRARRLQAAFQIDLQAAVQSAAEDWTMLNVRVH